MADNPLLTPEDKAALAELPQRIRDVRAQARIDAAATRTELRQALVEAQKAHLAPWMVAFAEWYALQPKCYSLKEQLRVAREFANAPLTQAELRNAKTRPDWHVLVDKFYQGGIVAARAKMEADASWYIDMHKKGLKKADEAEDYRAFPNFTLPWIERVAPRRDNLLQQNLQVNVILSEKQHALLDGTMPEVEAEVLPPATPHE